MAVVGVLTKRSGEVVEFRHALHSDKGQKEHLQSLAHSLKKLQHDVNSCLTEIIEQEKTSTTETSAFEKREWSNIKLSLHL